MLGGNYDCTWHKSFFFLLTFLDYFYHAWSKHLRSWSSENKPEVFLFPMWLAVKRTNANAMWSFGVPILCGEYVQVNKQLRLFSSAVFFLTYVYVRVLNTRQWTSLRMHHCKTAFTRIFETRENGRVRSSIYGYESERSYLSNARQDTAKSPKVYLHAYSFRLFRMISLHNSTLYDFDYICQTGVFEFFYAAQFLSA